MALSGAAGHAEHPEPPCVSLAPLAQFLPCVASPEAVCPSGGKSHEGLHPPGIGPPLALPAAAGGGEFEAGADVLGGAFVEVVEGVGSAPGPGGGVAFLEDFFPSLFEEHGGAHLGSLDGFFGDDPPGVAVSAFGLSSVWDADFEGSYFAAEKEDAFPSVGESVLGGAVADPAGLVPGPAEVAENSSDGLGHEEQVGDVFHENPGGLGLLGDAEHFEEEFGFPLQPFAETGGAEVLAGKPGADELGFLGVEGADVFVDFGGGQQSLADALFENFAGVGVDFDIGPGASDPKPPDPGEEVDARYIPEHLSGRMFWLLFLPLVLGHTPRFDGDLRDEDTLGKSWGIYRRLEKFEYLDVFFTFEKGEEMSWSVNSVGAPLRVNTTLLGHNTTDISCDSWNGWRKLGAKDAERVFPVQSWGAEFEPFGVGCYYPRAACRSRLEEGDTFRLRVTALEEGFFSVGVGEAESFTVPELFMMPFTLLEIWLDDGYSWWYLLPVFLTSQMLVFIQIWVFSFEPNLEGAACKSILSLSAVQFTWRLAQVGECGDPSVAVLLHVLFPLLLILLVDPLRLLKRPILFRILWIVYASFFLWQSFQLHLLFYLVFGLYSLRGEKRHLYILIWR